MAQTWPAYLPQSLPVNMPEEYVDGRGQFQPDTGPIRTVILYTATPMILRPKPMIYSSAQWAVMVTFFDTTLAHGVRSFEWTNPWRNSGASPAANIVTFKFLDRPQVTWLKGRMSVPTADLAGGTNPMRVGEVTFSLIRLPWWPPTG